METVEMVEAEEIVIANCNIHEQDRLEASPFVNNHTADTAVMVIAPVKQTRERKLSTVLIEKAVKFRKALSLPKGRLPRTSKGRYYLSHFHLKL